MRRILSTKMMAKDLGMKPREFIAFKKMANFPQPVRGTLHHLWWDSIAVHNYFDKLSNIKPESSDHDAIILGRLADGKGAREIFTHS